jgi:hypothetical protein
MRTRLTSAHAIALLALFVSLGGSSYAALKISGRDVRDGSLTGRDIKKGSVGLDRLARKPLDGVPGPAGPAGTNGTNGTNGQPGAPGQPGTPDGYTKAEADARFLAPGPFTITASGDDWINVAGSAGMSADRYATFTQIESTGTGTKGIFLAPDVTMPTTRAVEVTGMRICLSASATRRITSIKLVRRRPTGSNSGEELNIVDDSTVRQTGGCIALTAPTAVALEPADLIYVNVQANFIEPGSVVMGAVTIYLTQK